MDRIYQFFPLVIVSLLIVGATPVFARAASYEEINREILSRVEALGTVHGYTLDIETRGDTVWLRGTVRSSEDRAAVEDAARKVQGVAEIHNQISIFVAPPSASRELALRVRENVHPLSRYGEQNILISAEDGTILLEGSAGSAAHRNRIEAAARGTPGVRTVINTIRISGPPDIEIAERIRREIAAVPSIRIERLKVTVQDGVAVLSGHGRNHRDIDHALALALDVPGVTDVKSEFTLRKP